MGNFTFYAPTRVFFGRKEEERIETILKQEGCHKVLVHYGGQSAVNSGLLPRVLEAIEKAGISYVTLGGVVPNPQLSKVREGIELAKKEQVDFILAVGGGSVIDSAKGIGYGVVNEGDVWEYYARKKKVTGCLPIGAILTIAAAGSEMSNSSVITNEDGWLKRGLSSDYGRCRFAVMNPELTMTLPYYQTASGCTDIILHTMERYFIKKDMMDITDGFAESLMRTVMKHSRILMKEPDNYESRAEVMWAGSLSHNDITGSRGFGDWACHQLEHELSGMFQVLLMVLVLLHSGEAGHVMSIRNSHHVLHNTPEMLWASAKKMIQPVHLQVLRQQSNFSKKSGCRHPYMKWGLICRKMISVSWRRSAALRMNEPLVVSVF